MEYEIISQVIDEDKFIKYHIKESEDYLSFDEVLGLFENDQDFRNQFLRILEGIPFQNFNIECPSIKIDDINKSFEFVAVNSDRLEGLKPNSNAFEEHFIEDELTAIFENLGGDAILLSPKPDNGKAFTHLRLFLINASEAAKHDLLIALGEITTANLRNEPIWINTSGFGVPWLHIRIDDKPKYYRFNNYKK